MPVSLSQVQPRIRMRNRVIDRSDFMTQQISDRVIVQAKETVLVVERGCKV
jgi:hypothetical protein